MSTFRERYGPWALVTGATTGIGAEFARQLAARGLDLILIARRAESLADLAQALCDGYSVRIKQVTAELEQRGFLSRVRAATRGLEIGLVVNHTGVALPGPFVENDLREKLVDEQKIVALNVRAPAILAREFGGQMAKRGRGAIVSVATLVQPQNSQFDVGAEAAETYSLTIAEALWYELAPHGVDVVALSSESEVGTEAVEEAENSQVPERRRTKVAQVLSKLDSASPTIPGKMFSAMNVMGEWIFSADINSRLKAALLSRSARANLN